MGFVNALALSGLETLKHLQKFYVNFTVVNALARAVMQRLEEARLNIEGSTSYKSVKNEAFLKNSYRLGKNMVTCPSCFSAQDFDCTEMAA